MSGASGYSGTPLPRKLGIRDGGTVCVLGEPVDHAALIAPLPIGAHFESDPCVADVVVFFVVDRTDFEYRIGELGAAVLPDRSLWIAWPKRASGVVTTMTEDVVREIALPRGLVDNKVCAMDAVWSGLRLVWRKELRGRNPTASSTSTGC
jgi:hypothetical protein